MKKIRGDKLQAINAECELQICLAFHEEGKNKQKKKPSKRNIENPQGEGNKISVNEIATLTIGELKGDDRTNLLELFNKLKAMWKFE